MADREKGTVKCFSKIKSYGFIEPEYGKDLFVHQKDLRNSSRWLNAGDRVEFTATQGKKGLQADDVVVLD